jgi:glycosyltransferase involved in cell wall biosynthesis
MPIKTVLFHRHFTGFQGGHLKVFDYINHVNSIPEYQTALFVTKESCFHEIWFSHTSLVKVFNPSLVDAIFLAGEDWQALSDYPSIEDHIPVFNLIQGFRHLDPNNKLYSYLPRKAIRVCVSPELTHGLMQTGACNGPLHTIPNCIDHARLPAPLPLSLHSNRVFIAGLKQPKLASQLAYRFVAQNINVSLCLDPLSRSEFLRLMNEASIAITLPLVEEGFYLPALEAMAMGKALICPDCVGNRSFCLDSINCLMPEFKLESIEAAVYRLLDDPDFACQLRERALIDSKSHTLERERSQFTDIFLSCMT